MCIASATSAVSAQSLVLTAVKWMSPSSGLEQAKSHRETHVVHSVFLEGEMTEKTFACFELDRHGWCCCCGSCIEEGEGGAFVSLNSFYWNSLRALFLE